MDGMKKFGTAPGHPFAPVGSIFFTRGQSLLARGIRWAERDPRTNEGESWANHVGIVVNAGFFVPVTQRDSRAWVSEALWTVKYQDWYEANKGKPGNAVAVMRPRNLSKEQLKAIAADAMTRVGDRYAWWRIPGFLVERLTGWNVSKYYVLKDRNVCSNHAGLALEKGGITFSQPAAQLDPDEMLDECFARPDEFEFLGWSVVPGIAPF